MRADDGILSPRWRELTIGLFLTIFVAAIEALSVATVMPMVEADLQDLGLYGWVFSAFFLGQIVGISTSGHLADRVPVRVPLALGLVVFAAGLAVGAAAPTMGVLVAGRALQGIGAGAIPAVAFAVIGRAYPDELRPAMFAVVSTAWALPAVVGPVVAGAVGNQLGWRWVFAGLLPFVAIAGGLAVHAVRVVPVVEAPSSRSSGRAGATAALVVGSVVALAGASLPARAIGLALAAAGLVLAAWAFRRLAPPGTLRMRPGVPAAVACKGLLPMAFFAGDAFVPFGIVQGRGGDWWLGSLAIMTVSLCWTAGSWVQARLVLRAGAIRLGRIGFALVGAGLAGMAVLMHPAAPVGLAPVVWAVAGLGMGAAYGAITGSVLAGAEAGGEGGLSAGMQLAETLGIAFGTGLAGAVIAGVVDQGATEARGAAVVFAGAAVLAVAGTVLVARIGDSVRRRAGDATVRAG